MLAPRTFRVEMCGDGVAQVTLDRPERLNALTFETYAELRDVATALARDAATRAVVLTGAGRGFCSGGDVEVIIGALLDRSPEDLLAFCRLTGETVLAWRRLRKPVIAAVNGVAAGGGAALALTADVRIAVPEARIGFVFTRVGLSGADMGVPWLLPRVVGLGRATELLLTGDLIDAATAERWGLYNRVVPADRLLDEARGLAARLAAGPTFALAATKETLDGEATMDLATALDAEARAQALCMTMPGFRRAHEAWQAGRAGQGRGRV